MKKLYFNLLSFVFLSALTNSSYAQERTLTGTVTTLNNILVVNAEVKVLSSNATVLTDSIGNFKISCLHNDKIKVSANGFFSQKVKIDEETQEANIDLKFKPKEKNVDIAVGYGHIKGKDKSFAISSIKNNNNDFSKFSTITELILSISPSIMYSNGGFVIRGESSLLGSSTAMIVIDGVGSNMLQLSTLQPAEIRSVDILKGGAAAIYGSRGGNGVIVVKTKGAKDEN